MALASARQEAYWTEQWLPYGAAALVTVAAILSAWPIYLLSFFPYVALVLVAIGTPASMYLRAANANRRILNIMIVGVSLVFIFSMLRSIQLPSGGDLVSIALFIDDRVAVALVIQMFITVAMFRSFSLLTDRDLTLTVVPAVSTLLLSSIIVRGAGIIISLLLFFLGALYLLAFNHQESLGQRGDARLLAPPRRRSLLAGGISTMWLVLVPATFVAAIVFGWINLPRALMMRYSNYLPYIITRQILQIAAPSWVVPRWSNQMVLSDGLSLRNNIVFRVDSTESALWRAETLDVYTGRGWRTESTPYRVLLERQGDSWSVPTRDMGIAAGVPSSDLRQVFHLAVPMQGVVVAAYEPRSLSGPFFHPRVSDSSVLTNAAPFRSSTVYTVVSQRKTAPGAAVYRPGVTMADEERKRYLALPEIPARTRRLARKITAAERDDRDRAIALRAYLESNFVYRERVELPPAEVGDYVDYFLHEMDGAYCDYFASASAVLARLNGIPSRVVAGFSSDEDDEETGWYVVREKHAHSWVEVFIDGYGWLELDPSPAPGRQPSLLERAQKAMSQALQRVRRAALAPLRALVATPGWWWKLPGIVASLVLVILGVRYLRRDKPLPLPRTSDAEQLRQYVRRSYDRMCGWLAAWGLPKPPGATASEYAAGLAQTLGAQAQVIRGVIGTYLAAEYSGRPLERADAAGIADGLHTVLTMRKLLLRRARERTEREDHGS
ncbi:MAG: DUF4129 domain-containing protein [Armatimonadota bacterium]|nr:MAG: DUF4129 domain-containing protein [Armatimonadota bacterium]